MTERIYYGSSLEESRTKNAFGKIVKIHHFKDWSIMKDMHMKKWELEN